MKLHLTCAQLRGLVNDAVPFDSDFGGFTESSKDDGCLWYTVESVHDEFPISVPLKPFLAARFGIPVESVILHWSDYEWRYSADLEGVELTDAERQKIDEYDF